MAIVTHHADSANPPAPVPACWQQALVHAVRDPAELCRLVEMPPEHVDAAKRLAGPFGLLVPRAYVAKMTPGDPHDPLLRQVLPLAEELDDTAGFSDDPVEESASEVSPGLLKKYPGRVLMITTPACAVHCRYCFRRRFPYRHVPLPHAAVRTAVAQVAADPTIEEVILSGGDPLTLHDESLAELARRLAEIRHLHRLRIHTRLPIVIPERVTDDLVAWLTGTRLVPVVVVHANHPRELDAPVASSLARLIDAGVAVLNQAVLLRGVNDDVDTLVELCRRLVDQRVIPYYLHQLDRVSGAAHFEVPAECGRELVRQLRTRLPGYAVPRYVREVPGEPNKRVLQ